MVAKKPPKTAKKPLKPSLKQRKYINNKLIKGMNNYQASLKAGYSKNTSLNTLKNIESKPAVKHTMAQALEKAGLTVDFMAKHIRSGMRSKKALVINNDIQYVYDKSTQHRYLETGLRLAGYGSDTNININVDNRKQYAVLPADNDNQVIQTASVVPDKHPKKDK